MNNKITVLISAYNSEKYIIRLFDSLLNQTNTCFEVIVCNDGSNDNTAKTLNYFAKEFFNKKIQYHIINKENGGVSSAINAMLPLIKTDYFISCDSDDWYDKNLIDSVSNYIKTYGDFAFGSIAGARFYKEDLTYLYTNAFKQSDCETNMFKRLIYSDNIPCYTGIFIYNTVSFKKNNGSLSIYDNRKGQNWQLLLPMALNEKMVLIDGTYYNYLIRESSVSHVAKTFDEEYNLLNNYKNILDNVLFNLNSLDYRSERMKYYDTRLCLLCYKNKKRKLFFKHYKNANKSKQLFLKMVILAIQFWRT